MGATGWHITEPEAAAQVMNLSRSALQRLNYSEVIEDVKQVIRIIAEHLPLVCIVFYPLWIWAYRTDKLIGWNPDIVTLWAGGGFRVPWRPLALQELTPIGWTPPSPTPSPTPTPKPTATPTPSPSAAPAGLSTEQIIIAIVIMVIIAAIAYLAVKARRKPKT